MGNCSSKFHSVKPYLPDPSVDWDLVDLHTTAEATKHDQEKKKRRNSTTTKEEDIGDTPSSSTRAGELLSSLDFAQEFADPIVHEEFTVYMNRDIASMVNGVIYATVSLMYLSGALNITENRYLWGIWEYIASTILLVTVGLDLYCYLTLVPNVSAGGSEVELARRKRLSRYRYLLKFPLLVGLLLTSAIIPDISLRKRNCINAVDWMAMFGLRTKWEPSSSAIDNMINNQTATTTSIADDWTNNCPRVFHPFPVFALTIVTVTATIPTRWILVFHAALLLLNLTSFTYFPYEDSPLSTSDWIFRVIFYLAAAATGAINHAIRWWSSMSQFKQQLILLQETSRATRSEKEVENLLCSILPSSALDRLAQNIPVADFTEQATVFFSDIKGFTAWSASRSARQVVAMLDAIVIEVDDLTLQHGVEKIKTVGDAYWAVAGLPEACEDHAQRICRFGLMFLEILEEANKRFSEWEGISVRIGIHSGPLSGGILGTQQLSYEVFGDTNTIAGKVEQAGVAGDVCVTEDTLRALGIDIPSASSPSFVGEIPPYTVNGGIHWDRLPEVYLHPSALVAPIKIFLLPRTEDLLRRSSDSQNPSLAVDTFGARRRVFFKDEQELEQVSQEELQTRYNKRRYKYVFPDFASGEQEEEFIRYFRDKKAKTILITRVMMLALVMLLAIAIYTSTGTSSTPATGGKTEEDPSLTGAAISVSISLLLASIDLCLCKISIKKIKRIPQIQAALACSVCIPFMVAISLGFGASIMTGTSAPPIFIANCICLFGNIGFISAATLTANYVLHWIVYCAFEWNRFITPITLLGAPLAVLMYGFINMVMESTYRQHFVQLKVSRYFQEQQAMRNKEREVLLRAMVPSHVVDELLSWMQRGMLLEESIVETLPRTMVAFLHFEAPPFGYDSTLHSQLYNPQQDTALLMGGGPSNSDASTAALSMTGNGPKDGRWLIDLHRRVDNIMSLGFNTSIIKIKTIGDVAMLSGPFATSSMREKRQKMIEDRPKIQLTSHEEEEIGEEKERGENSKERGEEVCASTTTLDAASPGSPCPLIVRGEGNDRISPLPADDDAEDKDDSTEMLTLDAPTGGRGGKAASRPGSRREGASPLPALMFAEEGELGMTPREGSNGQETLAGDETEEESGLPLVEASLQLMDIIYRIKTEICPDFRTGIHVGELVGGVLGTNRLCFDIFGDSVNTASRVMTSGRSHGGEISCSREFLKCIDSISTHQSLTDGSGVPCVIPKPSDEAGNTSASTTPHQRRGSTKQRLPFRIEYDDPTIVTAKGKGKIAVYRLTIIDEKTAGASTAVILPPVQ